MKDNTLKPKGFTIVELLVVMAVVGILSSLVFSGVGDSQARSRDTERATDIDNLNSKLEEYHSDKGGYPNTFTATTLTGINPQSLIDPNGVSIAINSPVASQHAARAVSNPTNSGANYRYIPYPTGCTAITCTGYVLKTYIERPSNQLPNPYAHFGINNN